MTIIFIKEIQIPGKTIFILRWALQYSLILPNVCILYSNGPVGLDWTEKDNPYLTIKVWLWTYKRYTIFCLLELMKDPIMSIVCIFEKNDHVITLDCVMSSTDHSQVGKWALGINRWSWGMISFLLSAHHWIQRLFEMTNLAAWQLSTWELSVIMPALSDTRVCHNVLSFLSAIFCKLSLIIFADSCLMDWFVHSSGNWHRWR